MQASRAIHWLGRVVRLSSETLSGVLLISSLASVLGSLQVARASPRGAFKSTEKLPGERRRETGDGNRRIAYPIEVQAIPGVFLIASPKEV